MQVTSAERLLEHQRELARLDGRDHAALRGARELGVEVERARRPADLVAVLDQRLAALARHQLGQLVGPVAHAGRHLVQRLRALGGGRARPLALGACGRPRSRRRAVPRRACRPRRSPPRGRGPRRSSAGPLPAHQLAADQQSRVHGAGWWQAAGRGPPEGGPQGQLRSGAGSALGRIGVVREQGLGGRLGGRDLAEARGGAAELELAVGGRGVGLVEPGDVPAGAAGSRCRAPSRGRPGPSTTSLPGPASTMAFAGGADGEIVVVAAVEQDRAAAGEGHHEVVAVAAVEPDLAAAEGHELVVAGAALGVVEDASRPARRGRRRCRRRGWRRRRRGRR